MFDCMAPRRAGLTRRGVLGAVAAAAHTALAGTAGTGGEGPVSWPEGWPANRDWLDARYRVANYSGGFEAMFKTRRVPAAAWTAPLTSMSARQRSAAEPLARKAHAYQQRWPVTGLLLARRGTILYEGYRFGRQPAMRMTSWSMAKGVTALLLGVCFDRRLVGSLQDRAGDYVRELRGTLHGNVTLRNLLNMSSGADVSVERDMGSMLSRGLADRDSDSELLVRDWDRVREPQGTRYNYNELCAIAVGMVIRSVTSTSLAHFCQEALWRPLGAEGDASWLCDSQGHECNGIGFAARLRDWARLGQLVAQGGEVRGQQVVSRRWIEECASWTADDAQVRQGVAEPAGHYKCFFWHGRPDGAWMMMVGLHGQRMIIDRSSQTVAVQTAVDQSALWVPELDEMVRAAAQL